MAAAKQAQKLAYAEALRSQMAARAAGKEGNGGTHARPPSARRPLAPNAAQPPPPSPLAGASCAPEGEGECQWERYMLREQRRLLSDVYL